MQSDFFIFMVEARQEVEILPQPMVRQQQVQKLVQYLVGKVVAGLIIQLVNLVSEELQQLAKVGQLLVFQEHEQKPQSRLWISLKAQHFGRQNLEQIERLGFMEQFLVWVFLHVQSPSRQENQQVSFQCQLLAAEPEEEFKALFASVIQALLLYQPQPLYPSLDFTSLSCQFYRLDELWANFLGRQIGLQYLSSNGDHLSLEVKVYAKSELQTDWEKDRQPRFHGLYPLIWFCFHEQWVQVNLPYPLNEMPLQEHCQLEYFQPMWRSELPSARFLLAGFSAF